jgi:hypothetical protein
MGYRNGILQPAISMNEGCFVLRVKKLYTACIDSANRSNGVSAIQPFMVRLETRNCSPEHCQLAEHKKEVKMHPEQAECRFCGGCLEKNKDFAQVDAQDNRWLDEMGGLISSAVEGMNKVKSFATYCHESLATH